MHEGKMQNIKTYWKNLIAEKLQDLANERGRSLDEEALVAEVPSQKEWGDLSFPLFSFARTLRLSPQLIASRIAERLEATRGKVSAEGAYLNVFLDRVRFTETILKAIDAEGQAYGETTYLLDKNIMVEFSGPNLNKPLHLGHLRNNIIGESLSRLLKASGGQVKKTNILNDRGVNICKSMLAYLKFAQEGETPVSCGKKGDHFVGDYYVRYNRWASEDPSVEKKVRAMLKKWEEGDEEVISLWKKMNKWALEGLEETYKATNISFDFINYESDTYLLGKEEVLKGCEKGVLYRDESGAIVIDLSEEGMDTKVLLRSDGTTVYMTQDIGTAITRYKAYSFEEMIYVAGAEQRYHFEVLFLVLKRLGYQWADRLENLAHGMVTLPDGKMKSREGTVVDADNLLADLYSLAEQEVRERGRESALGDPHRVAREVALGALHYYLLQTSPQKDMHFLSDESLSFTGNTGPYLQYTGARISSIIEKYRERFSDKKEEQVDFSLLLEEVEWDIVKSLSLFPETITQAACERDPSHMTTYLFTLAKQFSRYYHDHPVLNNKEEGLIHARMSIVRAVDQVLKNGLVLLNIPFLKSM